MKLLLPIDTVVDADSEESASAKAREEWTGLIDRIRKDLAASPAADCKVSTLVTNVASVRSTDTEWVVRGHIVVAPARSEDFDVVADVLARAVSRQRKD